MALPNPKPYSIQSPDALIEISGGNKQKLMQMVQAGTIDQTSALLAAMKIDKIRAAAQMEQAPQQTVMQKAFAPPAPPPSPGGLGAISPQGGGMPAPQDMQMASAAPAGLGAMPPVGMAAGGMTELPEPNNPYNTNAGGGLTTLPIPDSMYDEQSFAGGGIVAFAEGGDARAERLKALMASVQNPNFSFAERRAMMQEINELNRGVDAGPLPPATELDRDRASLLRTMSEGSKDSELPLALQKRLASDAYYGSFTPPPLPNIPLPQAPQVSAPSLTVAPPAKGLGAVAPSAPTPAPAPVRRAPATTPPPAATGATDTMPDYMKALMTPVKVGTPEDEAAKIEKYLREPPKMALRTDEQKAAQKNEDLWSALAQIGFGMAAGDSPNALVNISKAASAAIPGMQEAIKERRKEDKEDLKQQLAFEMSKYGMKKDAYLEAMKHVDDMTKDERARALAVAQIGSAEATAAENRKTQIQAANIQASAPTGGERLNALNVAAFKQHYLDAGKTPAEAEYLARKDVLAAGNPYASLTPQRGLIESQIEQATAARATAFKNRDRQGVADADAEIKRLQSVLRNLGVGSPVGGLNGGLTPPDYSGFKVTPR